MLLRMTDEPEDYEGPWPREDAMGEWKLVPVEPTDEMLDLAQGNSDLYRLDLVRAYRAMLEVAPEPPNDTMTAEECRAFQRWAGVDGAVAWNLIARHAEGWGETGRMMNAWLDANRAAPATPQERYRSSDIERRAPARREEMAAFAAELKADPAKALKFFQEAGILNERGELTPQYGGPVQQAEPVASRYREKHAVAECQAFKESADHLWRYTNGCPSWLLPQFSAHLEVEHLVHPPPAEVQDGFDFREECDRRAHVIASLMSEAQRLREALKRIVKRTSDGPSFRVGQDVHDIARAALDALEGK